MEEETDAEGRKAGKGGAPGKGGGGAGKGASASVGGAGQPGQPLIDLDFVRGLIDAVDGSGIDSLEITRAGTRVKISKTPPTAAPGPALYAPPGIAMQAPQPSQAAGAAGPAAGSEAASGGSAAGGAAGAEGAAAGGGASSGLVDVKSPMVGTFYRAPAPEAPPYVEVGTRVSKGQTLCILEAMKLMNEMESEVEGVVREVLVDNADPVEYGQVLFRIDPSG